MCEKPMGIGLFMLILFLGMYLCLTVYYLAFYDPRNVKRTVDRSLDLSKLQERAHYKVKIVDDGIQGVCSVCKLSLYTSEDVLNCPMCQLPAHTSHFLEWIKIKGVCPICKAPLGTKNREIIVT